MLTHRNHHLLGSYYSLSGLIIVLFLLAGCCPTALTTYKSRPFFLIEEDVTTHGRKAWYDSIIELDPGGAEFTVAADYQQAPPKKIAVLPFTDLGEGDFVVNKLPLLPRSDEERRPLGMEPRQPPAPRLRGGAGDAGVHADTSLGNRRGARRSGYHQLQ